MSCPCPRRACLTTLVLATVASLLCGCSSTISGHEFMHRVDQPSMQAPPGKALVIFHRPEKLVAGGLTFTVWDEEQFVGLTLGGQGLAYACDAGQHTFVGRCEMSGHWGAIPFGEYTTAIDATLEAGRVYDVYCEAHWKLVVHTVKLRPVTQSEEKLRRKVPGWIEDAKWQAMRPESPERLAAFEAQERATVQEALAAAAAEADLPRLSPEDGRPVERR